MYAEMAEKVKNYIHPEVLEKGRAARRLWCAGVIPGFDDRKIRHPGTYVSRKGGRYYERIWRAAIASGADIVTICSWNEWHEGTEIEPSREYGFEYLNLTRKFVQFYKNASVFPEIPAPRLVASFRNNAAGTVLVLSNEGSVPAVITSLIVKYRGTVLVSHGYSLNINNVAKIIFIPYIGLNEEIEVLTAPVNSEITIVEGVAWSPGLSASAAIAIRSDDEPPRIDFTSLTGGERVAGQVYLKVNVNDNTGVERFEIYIDDELVYWGRGLSHSFEWNTSEVDDGFHTVVFKVFDMAGNVAEKSLEIVVDNTPPILKILDTMLVESEHSFVVTIEAMDSGGVGEVFLYYRLDSEDWRKMAVKRVDNSLYKGIITYESRNATLAYFVEAKDSLGNIARTDIENIDIIVYQHPEKALFIGRYLLIGIIAFTVLVAVILVFIAVRFGSKKSGI